MACTECESQNLESEIESEVIGRDTRVRVTDTTRAPFRFICKLLGEKGGCSGTLIGPSTVLTAAHCTKGRASRMRVIPGRNGTGEPFGSARGTKFVTFPGADIAIVHLDAPLGASVGYWSRLHSLHKDDPIGTSIAARLPLPAGMLKINLSGYPGDLPAGKKFDCLGPGRHALCGKFQYRAYDATVRRAGRMLHHLDDTYRGHSGSPVWVRRHPSLGGRVLVGVHVAGSEPGAKRKTNRAVLIDAEILKFIIANTK